jgi:pimeloyl-ACP methyl ester carboxylesterase
MLQVNKVVLRSIVAFGLLVAVSCTSTNQSSNADISGSIEWSDCFGPESPGTPFQCAGIEVPLDYSDSNGEKITIQMVRIPADPDFEYQGVLFTNPGGPGESGFDFLVSSGLDLINKVELGGFDVVGFDPRGVDRSNGLRCSTDEERDRFAYLDFTPDNSDEKQLLAAYEADESNCESRLGKSIIHYSTENIARDMEVMREGMGVKTINYLGISYGTYLGGVYATLFPDHVSSMVLDGGYDPQGDTIEQEYSTGARGFESAFSNWVQWCESSEECAFRFSDVRLKWERLYSQLDAESLLSTEMRYVNHRVLMTATKAMLYAEWGWTYLGQALSQAENGNPDLLLAIADSQRGRNEDGTYSTSGESRYVIHCASGFDRGLPSNSSEFVKKLKAESPWYFRELEASDFEEAYCESIFADQSLFEISYTGNAPIVVIGGMNDPATPLRWSEELALNMGSNKSLVKFSGEGHSQILESKCVNKIAGAVFRELTIPTSGITCNPDQTVKKPIWWSNMPKAARLGTELDATVLNDALESKDTEKYSEYRVVSSSVEEVFKRIKDAFLSSGYEMVCNGDEDSFNEPCFFLKGGVEQFGVLIYSESEIFESDLTEPDGPVPANSTLIDYYYFP